MRNGRFNIDPSVPTAEQLRHMSEPGKGMVDRYIAYKWEGKGSKGWVLGKILAQQCDDLPYPQEDPEDDNDGDNFFVDWADGVKMAIFIDAEYYVNTTEVRQKCVQNSWTLLVEQCGDDVASMAAQGELRNPVRPSKKGRKSHLRLAPAAGPTSRSKRRKS